MQILSALKNIFIDRPALEMRFIDQLRFSPFLVQMVVTRRCNLKCGYCNEYDSTSEPVRIDIIKSWIDKAVELGVLSVEFTGGEPLLHPQIAEVIAYATEKNLQARMMISNGYLFTEEKIHQLNDAGLTHLQVSVDGVKPNETTVKVLDPLREKLEMISRLKKFEVQLSGVIGAAPKDEVLEVIRFAKGHDFLPRVLILHDGEGEVSMSAEELDAYREVKLLMGKRFAEAHNYRDVLINGDGAPYKCRAGSRYIYVDEFGLAARCSQRRKAWSKFFLDVTLNDMKENFYTVKPCNNHCTLGCSRTSSAYDEWRDQFIIE